MLLVEIISKTITHSKFFLLSGGILAIITTATGAHSKQNPTQPTFVSTKVKLKKTWHPQDKLKIRTARMNNYMPRESELNCNQPCRSQKNGKPCTKKIYRGACLYPK